jgi:hypothetical protein
MAARSSALKPSDVVSAFFVGISRVSFRHVPARRDADLLQKG